MATHSRQRGRGSVDRSSVIRYRSLATSVFVLLLATWLLATTVGGALAHSGHDHADTTDDDGLILPAALLLGGGAVLGTSVYLDRAGEIEGWMGRGGVLLGIVGLLTGAVLALF